MRKRKRWEKVSNQTATNIASNFNIRDQLIVSNQIESARFQVTDRPESGQPKILDNPPQFQSPVP